MTFLISASHIEPDNISGTIGQINNGGFIDLQPRYVTILFLNREIRITIVPFIPVLGLYKIINPV